MSDVDFLSILCGKGRSGYKSEHCDVTYESLH
jgi:hypothetical protein